MTAKAHKLYQEQLNLTKWFGIVTALCALLLAASYYWLHSMLILVIGIMFGPIFLLLTLVFAGLAIASKIKLDK